MTDTGQLDINIGEGVTPKISIKSNGDSSFSGHILGSEGLNFPNLSTASSSTTPLGITSEGWIYKTATTYSAEEVDKKLAVMQKIIDKLEKKLK